MRSKAGRADCGITDYARKRFGVARENLEAVITTWLAGGIGLG